MSSQKSLYLYPAFDNVQKMQGLVNVLSTIFNEDLGRYLVQDFNGNWKPLPDTPAIYLGYSNIPSPDYPSIVATFNGVSDAGAGIDVGRGVTTVIDPLSKEPIDIPYSNRYLLYTVTLTFESGSMDEVLRGVRKSSTTLITKLMQNLTSDGVRELINTEMTSSPATSNFTFSQIGLDRTVYHDTSTVILKFHTVSTLYNFNGGWFDSIEINYELHRGVIDPSPITGSLTVELPQQTPTV